LKNFSASVSDSPILAAWSLIVGKSGGVKREARSLLSSFGGGDGNGDGGLFLGSVWVSPNERLGLGLGFVIGRPPFAPFMACLSRYSRCFFCSFSCLLFKSRPFFSLNLPKTCFETSPFASNFKRSGSDESNPRVFQPCASSMM